MVEGEMHGKASRQNERRWRGLTLLLPIVAFSCASKVDLNHAVVESSPDPTVVGIVREGVGHIAVDDQRLYWTALPTRNGAVSGTWALRSCSKQNCAASVVTYDTHPSGQDIWFGVEGGNIYWFQDDTPKPVVNAVMVPVGGMTLVGSPVAGGVARTVATTGAVELAVFETDRVYVSTSTGVYSIALSGEGAPVPLIGAPLERSYVLALALEGDYIYWLSGGNPQDYTAGTRTSLYRLRKDGSSSTPEKLASQLEVNVSLGYGFTPIGFALDSNDVYWTRNVLAGAIDRCPVSGCPDVPEVVVGPIRSPEALLIDGSKLYVRNEVDAYRYAISSCSIGQCAAPEPIAQGLDAKCAAETEMNCGPTGSMAIDDQYLYVVTTDQDLQTESAQENPVAQIRRLPK